MPSVLGLMERREARARQDLESWTEVLEQAQAEVDAARERVLRSTTHLRASTTNPRCPSDRRTTSIRTPWRANAFASAGPW